MSRIALTGTAVLLAWAGGLAEPVGAVNPHLDLSVVEGGCNACHEGHGMSRSPMLPAPQAEVCLSCHGAKATADRQVAGGAMASDADPQLMEEVLAKPHTHPLTEGAFSRREPDAVTCTSCHTPHRGAAERVGDQQATAPGRRKLSTRDPNRFEFELCQSCHGSLGVKTQSLFDLGRLTSPNNRSFHPIEAATEESSPSVLPALSGLEVNCSDCHGNSDTKGPRGPHGSDYVYLLGDAYTTTDGGPESAEQYALCYSCHDRDLVLDSSPFPLHRSHVVDLQVSCATCHNAHGSVDNRALIRFGEETILGSVGPSARAGVLAFESQQQGEGLCYLTCHGVDHGPASYRGMIATPTSLSGFGSGPAAVGPPGAPRPSGPPLRGERRRPLPPRD